MKKLFTSFTSLMLVLLLTLSNVSAISYDTTNLEGAKQKLITYLESKKTLNIDSIIAYESLGIDTTNGYTLPSDLYTIEKTSDISEVTKTLIAVSLQGKDPSNIDNKNLIELTENLIQEDGTINTQSAGMAVYVVNALYIVGSSKLDQAVEYLLTLQNEDGSFGYGGNSKNLDITGWVLETLSLVGDDKYQTQLDKTKEFLVSKIADDGLFSHISSWDNQEYESGKNGNTQATGITGLLTYNKDGLLNGTYDKNNINPIDALLTFQDTDGHFLYQAGNGYDATNDCARFIGCYANGNVYEVARKKYQSLSKVSIEQPTVTAPVTTDKEVTSVKTGDNSNYELYAIVTMVTTGLFLSLRKQYATLN